MSIDTSPTRAGHGLFVRYAYPPNELGYCGPADSQVLLRGHDPREVATRAREFDGAWPYLQALAGAAGVAPLDAAVVRSYWIGGPLLDRVDPAGLLGALRVAFVGQATGLLGDLTSPAGVLAHHSFHVFVVYPWVRFLDRDQPTALNVLQNCRIRWGTVHSVDGDHVSIESRPVVVHERALTLGAPVNERIRWCRDGASLTATPTPGSTVSAHWGWVCDTLTDDECDALAAATATTLDLVNTIRGREHKQ